MEQSILKIKSDFCPEAGRTYSICMRGARSWDRSQPLKIYTNGNGDLLLEPILIAPSYVARITSQKHFKFDDVPAECTWDNYDSDARSNDGLFRAMKNIYVDFDTREIVTILRFII